MYNQQRLSRRLIVKYLKRVIATLGIYEHTRSCDLVHILGNVIFWNLIKIKSNFIATFLSNLKFKADWNENVTWLLFLNLNFIKKKYVSVVLKNFNPIADVIITRKVNNDVWKISILLYFNPYNRQIGVEIISLN